MGRKKSNNMVGKETSSLAKANDKSYSLRTTVPKGVVKHCELEVGDLLNWEIHEQNGKRFMVVYPEKTRKQKNKRD